MSNSYLLVCENLCKSYEDGKNSINVIKNVSFSIKKGEMIAILGRSGSGKSTLLHLLGGLDKPTSGDIIFNDKRFSSLSSKEKAEIRNHELGFIYQFHHLLPDFTVLENVMIPLLIAKKMRTKNRQQAEEILEEIGLSQQINRRPAELSGGERQRVAIARAIINNPSLVLADEPTGNLDSENVNVISNLLSKVNKKKGTAFLVVTHDIRFANFLERKLKILDGYLQDEHFIGSENNHVNSPIFFRNCISF